MKDRCLDPNSSRYRDWGGRGIAPCAGWMVFDNFIKSMGRKPSPASSLERVNNDLGYFCGECEECTENNRVKNCKWGSLFEQNRNKRSNVWVEFRGERKIALDWANLLGIPAKTVYRRISEGKTDPTQILAPVKVYKKKEETV